MCGRTRAGEKHPLLTHGPPRDPQRAEEPGDDNTRGALNVIVEEVDRLRTTAGSHKRIFVVETMGRTAGWLGLEGGEACGAFIILIPECEFSMEKVNELVLEGRREGARYEIIVAAEGAKLKGGSEFVKREVQKGRGAVDMTLYDIPVELKLFSERYIKNDYEADYKQFKEEKISETKQYIVDHYQRYGFLIIMDITPQGSRVEADRASYYESLVLFGGKGVDRSRDPNPIGMIVIHLLGGQRTQVSRIKKN